MEKISSKILILGSTGMIGHKVFQVLSKNKNFQLFNASKSKLNIDTIIVNLKDMNQVEVMLEQIRPDVVVNAAGILIKDSQFQPLDAVLLNSVLPLSLDKLSKKIGFKLIQISTDCVFSGDNGPYQVSDIKDAKTIYGRAKALGEINDLENLTIRTSVIGPDLKADGKELFSWFMQQTVSIEGYSKAIWSGVSTLALANCIEECIVNNISGLHQLSSGITISKYDLLCILNNYRDIRLNIIKIDGQINNKALKNSEVFHLMENNYLDMVKEMVDDIQMSDTYLHYKLLKYC